MQLKTASDLRGFLAEVLVGIKSGEIDANKANAISKVAAQINQSMSTEVQTKIRLKELGEPVVGDMLITSSVDDRETPPQLTQAEPEPPAKPKAVVEFTPPRDEKIWCEQCESRVTVGQAVGCKSAHCKAKEAA
jgi:hypothetical protein